MLIRVLGSRVYEEAEAGTKMDQRSVDYIVDLLGVRRDANAEARRMLRPLQPGNFNNIASRASDISDLSLNLIPQV